MTTALVLPFYNERGRADEEQLARLCASGLDLLLVDDGSTDDTLGLLNKLAAAHTDRVRVLSLVRNAGKAEAVRVGMLDCLQRGMLIVGYADGDLATPVHELLRLAQSAEEMRDVTAVLGSRVRLADRQIGRRALRHYLGRLVATYVSARTGLAVYDTQCGTKFFRATPELRAALARPFATRWLFDVELLHRLQTSGLVSGGAVRLREEPLEDWRDVAGSRIYGWELLRVLRDFGLLESGLRSERSEGRPATTGPVSGETAAPESTPGSRTLP